MLYVQEKVVKLGGIYLEGQVTSVEVQEAGSVYVAQDEKGRYKKSQPVGYENAKVMIDILLEDTKTATTLEQLTEMQRLFKPYGQDKPKLLPIVNEDCAVRGITKVYFKNLTSKKVISESKRMSSWAELATRTIEEKLRNAAKAVPGVLDARIDAQHPRGQGTVDVIVTGAAGEASPELIRKVGEAIEPLKGNYEDYLVKSSEVVRQDFELVIYLAEDAATDGVDAQATKLIEDMMALTRGEMNTLYRDSIIQVLSTKIDNYRKTDILQPSDDMVLEQDKVIMAGDINVTVRNVVQSARGKE